jgi:aryl-alcohol dehydrogenase-like predicted oxidoreductase
VRQRKLGASGPVTSAIGFGSMGLSGVYGSADEDEGIATLRRALELGVTMIDAADIYGDGGNERLVGQTIAGNRNSILLATKFGGGFRPDGSWLGLGRPETVRSGSSDCRKRGRAADVTLDQAKLSRLDELLPARAIAADSYPADSMERVGL